MIIKCKMCGGELNIQEGNPICECEFCGTMQTVPQADNEKKTNLFNRANRLRMGAEFDKAATVYASITAEFPEEAEAYWGLCLSKYGIEYVDDPLTGKKIPTCHRTLTTSIMDDSDFDQACEYADPAAKKVYREEAKAIDRLQQDILNIVSSEEPYDVFICYKETDEEGKRTEDSVLAQDIYDSLTAKGLKVFFARISLEDKLGKQYEPYIYAALHSAKVMLAIGTQFEYFDAVWVKNEWSRFLDMMRSDKEKTLIPCYKGIDAYDMPREFKNLQAQDMGKLGWQQDLVRGVMKLCGKEHGQEVVRTVVQQSGTSGPTITSLLERARMFLEDGKWSDADQYADKVLDIEPKNANAHFIKLLAEHHLSSDERYAGMNDIPENDSNYQKAIRFADEELSGKINVWNKSITERKEYRRKTEILNSATKAIQLADTPQKCQKIMDDLESIAGFEGVTEAIESLQNRHKRLEGIQGRLRMIDEQIRQFKIIQKAEEEMEELGLFSGRRRGELEAKITNAKQRVVELEGQYNDSLYEPIMRIPKKNIEKELRYRAAMEYYNAGLLSEAADAFAPLLGYKYVDQVIAKDEALASQIPAAQMTQFMNEGSYVKFGNYPQGEDEEPEGIEWMILESRKNKCLLISKYGLDVAAYSKNYKDGAWESCSLRKWLNEEFLHTAFSEEEIQTILSSQIDNHSGDDIEIIPGNDTEDKVFLLSHDEVSKYFIDYEERVCYATDYALSKGATSNQWWLRSAGRETKCAFCINSTGAYQSFYVETNTVLVRPCLWLDLTSMVSEDENSKANPVTFGGDALSPLFM